MNWVLIVIIMSFGRPMVSEVGPYGSSADCERVFSGFLSDSAYHYCVPVPEVSLYGKAQALPKEFD